MERHRRRGWVTVDVRSATGGWTRLQLMLTAVAHPAVSGSPQQDLRGLAAGSLANLAIPAVADVQVAHDPASNTDPGHTGCPRPASWWWPRDRRSGSCRGWLRRRLQQRHTFAGIFTPAVDPLSSTHDHRRDPHPRRRLITMAAVLWRQHPCSRPIRSMCSISAPGPHTITLARAELQLTDTAMTTIQGPGRDQLTIDAAAWQPPVQHRARNVTADHRRPDG